MEFYFSDSNLPKDKFLKDKIASDPDGCELRSNLRGTAQKLQRRAVDGSWLWHANTCSQLCRPLPPPLHLFIAAHTNIRSLSGCTQMLTWL